MSGWIDDTPEFGRIDRWTLLGLDVHAALFSQILRYSSQMPSLEPFPNILPVIILDCLRFDLVDITGLYSFSGDEDSTKNEA